MIGTAFARTTASTVRLGAARCEQALRRVLAGGRATGAATGALALLLAASAVGLAVESDFAGRVSPLSGADAFLYDASVAALAALHRGDPWPTTAVVLIDRTTLTAPGWSSVPRALQQPQLGRLGRDLLDAGARRIGYDLVFAFDPADLPPPLGASPGYDAPLADLLASRGEDVVLGTDASVPPAPRYAGMVGPARLGVIDLQTEGDGRVRSVADRVRLPDGDRRFGFAAALARDPEGSDSLAGRTFMVPAAAVGTIPHLSGSEVATCLATPEGRDDLGRLLRGRTVVIGSGLGGEDEHAGPDRFLPRSVAVRGGGPACGGRTDAASGRKAARVPGAFLQAAAVEALQSRSPIALAPEPLRIGVDMSLACLVLAIMRLVDRSVRLPAGRSRMLGTTARSAAILSASLALLGATAIGIATFGLAVWRLWLPIGNVAAVMSGFCIAGTMAVALRRDMALADLKLAFGRWLPPHVVEATLDARRTVLHGSERIITVLMADLNDFTPFCAAHRDRPEAIVAAINRKFSLAQSAIDRHGGCLDKFDGDAVIAFWNGVQPQPDHASRAVRAALALIEADRSDRGSPLTFKCAIATGVAFVGRYGSEQKSSFSAIGEPMNLAARLEKLCRLHGIDIVIAGSTVESMSAAPPAGTRPERAVLVGQAPLKGFDDPVAFYTVSAMPD